MAALVRTHVLLPKELLDEIDSRLGEGRRSETIASLVREWVRRQRLNDAIEGVLASDRPAQGPKEWDTPEGTAQWVHDQRRIVSRRAAAIEEWIDDRLRDDAEALR